ncbi:MAG: adenylate/guanylate cyclase domain-containing protein [Kiloniellales bacterium]
MTQPSAQSVPVDRTGKRPAFSVWAGQSSDFGPEAAVAFVDVVGYSAMMARDEARTHVLWMSIFNGVIKPAIEDYGGAFVKSTGDGVLAIFDQADQAVFWAGAVQERTNNAGVDAKVPDLRIALRISVHCGPVIQEKEDVFGDAVNIAARLQQYAPPGGVIVSEAVFNRLSAMGDIPARNLGSLSLRNMTTPIRAYVLRFGESELPERAAPSMGTLPSIAVLPLDNLSGDPDDAYLAGGIVEDIIVSLASLRELMVISRASTLMFAGERFDPQEIGRALGVRYALTGSVRRSSRGLAISAQLHETQRGETLWAERFKSPLDGVFDIQDEIVERVVGGIAPTVRMREMRQALRKRPDTYSAYDYTLRALDIISNLDIDTFVGAREYLDRAMTEDPGFAMAFAWAARWRSILIGQGWSKDPSEDAREAERLAKRSIELDPQNALGLATCGHLKSFLFHDYDSALVYLERARDASPSSAFAWVVSSATESYLGRGDEAIRMAERSLRLSPKGEDLFFLYHFLGLAHYSAGAYNDAVKWARISEMEHPLYTSNLRMLSASLSAVGRIEEACEVADRLMAIEPGFGLTFYEQTRQPFKPPELCRRFIEHLRRTGLPE